MILLKRFIFVIILVSTILFAGKVLTAPVSVTPSNGSAFLDGLGRGTPLLINADNLQYNLTLTVTVFGVAATNAQVLDANTLTAITGAYPGILPAPSNVVITLDGLPSTLTNGYTYMDVRNITRSTQTEFNAGTVTANLERTTSAGEIFLRKGGAPALAAANGPNAPFGIRQGAHSLRRADGMFVVFRGSGSINYSVYNPTTNTFSASANAPWGFNISTGSHSFKRADGNFLVFRGGRSRNYVVYNPVTFTFSAVQNAPNNLNIGAGAHSVKLPNGNFLVIAGNGSRRYSIYNSGTNTFSASQQIAVAAIGGNLRAGAHTIPLSDGINFLIIRGNNTNNTALFNSTTSTFSAGPALPATVGAGGHSIQITGLIPDALKAFPFSVKHGRFLIICGRGTQNTVFYDPFWNRATAGPLTGGNVNNGGHSIQRGDGTYLLLQGGGSNNTRIFNPYSNAFALGPALGGASSSNLGSHSLRRADGQYLIIKGNNSNTTRLYNAALTAYASYNTAGTYTSDDIDGIAVDPAFKNWHFISWIKENGDTLSRSDDNSIEVAIRTASTQAGLATAPVQSVLNGSQVMSRGRWARVAITFSRLDIPASPGSEEDVWLGESSICFSWPVPTLKSLTLSYKTGTFTGSGENSSIDSIKWKEIVK